jgi:hypothetical protein
MINYSCVFAVKITRKEVDRSIDVKTGEILSHTEKHVGYIKVESEPPFIKVYFDDISRLFDLPKNASNILFCLAEHMSYKQQISVTASIKRQISSDLNTTVQVISNAISKYCKLDILQRIDHALYMFNPALIAKGTWQNIKEHRADYIELKIKYRNNGTKEISTQVGCENDNANEDGYHLDIPA